MYNLFARVKDPAARYRFHVFMAIFWALTMCVCPFVCHSDLVSMLILEVSLYANFSTEFGAIDASKASDSTEDIEASLKRRR